MSQIATFVFFDIETTGLPWQERNRTKIIEASLVAVDRKDIKNSTYAVLPPLNKLTFVLNPRKSIHPEVSKLTGLNNNMLKHACTFQNKFNTLKCFLEDLPQPLCLVAHNGNTFDFKILLAECLDIQVSLPNNLLCADSLIGFRKILKGTTISHSNLNPHDVNLLTDDEDDWPDMDVSTEDWEEIDELCQSFSDISYEDETDSGNEAKLAERDNIIKQVFSKSKTHDNKLEKCKKRCHTRESFTLSALYKRLLNKEGVNAHRAEADCLMLLECVCSVKEDFLVWADDACKPLIEITPLKRY